MRSEILSEKPMIVMIYDFLTVEECDKIIELARPHLKRSTVVDEGAGGSKVHGARTSEGMFLTNHAHEKIVRSVERKLSSLTGIEKGRGEAIQVLRYGIGAEYKPHYDYFAPHSKGGLEQLKRGGQRVATVIMYLNTVEAGGETVFPMAKVSVKPVKGNAVLFYNTLPTKEIDTLTLHGGAPVVAGEKWIATKWFREGEFR